MSGRLQRVLDWEGLAKDAQFQPSRMADLCLISLRQLERFFSQHFHQTPRGWMLELRCRLAKDLITAGYSNKAVAAELKFSNESHLCHAFKRVLGTPPQSFAPVCGRPFIVSIPDKNVVRRQ